MIPLTSDVNSQNADGDTALSAACSRYPSNVGLPIIRSLLDAGAEIAPQTPGPYSPFLDPKKRMEGFGVDPLLTAWDVGNHDVVRAILEAGTKRDLASRYETGLKLLEVDDMDGLGAWIDERQANATGKKPEIIAFRKHLLEREKLLLEEKRRYIEIGLVDAIGDLNDKELE